MKLKKMGVKLRSPFEPSRPEKYEKAPAHTQAKVQAQAKAPPVGGPEESYLSQVSKRNDTPKRKIISLNDVDSKALYEKEIP